MQDRNAQVGWTEAQWNRVREEVLRSWQAVRVAGSFLPGFRELPPSTQVVPSEMFETDGTIDERSVAPLLEIELPVTLTRQQVAEEDLTSALLQFRRAAGRVAQLEDWYIFNGTFPHDGEVKRATFAHPTVAVGTKHSAESYQPAYDFLTKPVETADVQPIADHVTQLQGLRQRNPGALGLLGGP